MIPHSQFTIPHYKKETDYTCGIAALRMALESLTKTKFSEETLKMVLGSTPELGTSYRLFKEKLDSILTMVHERIGTTLESQFAKEQDYKDLHHLLKHQNIVLLIYTKPNGGPHWAVLQSIDEKVLTLCDPDFGPNTTYALADLNWCGGIKEKANHGLIAIRLAENKS